MKLRWHQSQKSCWRRRQFSCVCPSLCNNRAKCWMETRHWRWSYEIDRMDLNCVTRQKYREGTRRWLRNEICVDRTRKKWNNMVHKSHVESVARLLPPRLDPSNRKYHRNNQVYWHWFPFSIKAAELKMLDCAMERIYIRQIHVHSHWLVTHPPTCTQQRCQQSDSKTNNKMIFVILLDVCIFIVFLLCSFWFLFLCAPNVIHFHWISSCRTFREQWKHLAF